MFKIKDMTDINGIKIIKTYSSTKNTQIQIINNDLNRKIRAIV